MRPDCWGRRFLPVRAPACCARIHQVDRGVKPIYLGYLNDSAHGRFRDVARRNISEMVLPDRYYDPAVPRPQSTLSATERNALDGWVARLEEADRRRKGVRADFAAWVREVGPAAVAHELGISRGAMNERLKSYEGTYKRRGVKGTE